MQKIYNWKNMLSPFFSLYSAVALTPEDNITPLSQMPSQSVWNNICLHEIAVIFKDLCLCYGVGMFTVA